MSAEENAAFENLLLLCFRHHKEIDRPEMVETYTEIELKEWKEDQVRTSKDGEQLSED